MFIRLDIVYRISSLLKILVILTNLRQLNVTFFYQRTLKATFSPQSKISEKVT